MSHRGTISALQQIFPRMISCRFRMVWEPRPSVFRWRSMQRHRPGHIRSVSTQLNRLPLFGVIHDIQCELRIPMGQSQERDGAPWRGSIGLVARSRSILECYQGAPGRSSGDPRRLKGCGGGRRNLQTSPFMRLLLVASELVIRPKPRPARELADRWFRRVSRLTRGLPSAGRPMPASGSIPDSISG